MMRSLLTLLACLLCFQTGLAQPVVPKGNRTLGIKVNQGKKGDYNAIFTQSLKIGNETQVLPLDWTDLETSPHTFKPTPNFLAIANGYYPARKVPIHLSLRPIHTNKKAVPKDLLNLPLNSPRTVQRFKKLLDWIATQIPEAKLETLVIGSEIDIYMWGSQKKWNEWTDFYAKVAPYARKRFPGTKITCETTDDAWLGPDLKRVRTLHEHSDVIGVSYYPVKLKHKGVHPPKSVHKDFAKLVRLAQGKPLIYYQIGYPSSSKLGSSPKIQAKFVTEAFRAWDAHSKRILMLNFQWMHETPGFGVDQYSKYYKNNDPGFRAFLGSLGLRTWTGQAKPAWKTLKSEAKKRGFGVR